MRLLEHQAKELFAESGLAIPHGEVVSHSLEARAIAKACGPRTMVKAQVRSGGRGKAGGVLMADTPDQAQQQAERLLGTKLQGEIVESVLVEERIEPTTELYLAVTTDSDVGCPLVLLGAAGGVDVELHAKRGPASGFGQLHLEPGCGLADYQLRYLLNRAALPLELRPGVGDAIRHLAQLYRGFDALLAEINPLASLADGRLVALDARMEVDDNALFRQPRLSVFRALSTTETRVETAGFHYVEMNGSVGLISTGSGACMALMDLLAGRGLRPANFMELGQSMGTGGTQVATEILLERSDVRAILVAGYSGGPLEKLMGGVLEVLANHPERDIPVVVSLQGRNDTEAMRLAAESGDPRVKTAAGYQAAVARIADLLGRR